MLFPAHPCHHLYLYNYWFFLGSILPCCQHRKELHESLDAALQKRRELIQQLAHFGAFWCLVKLNICEKKHSIYIDSRYMIYIYIYILFVHSIFVSQILNLKYIWGGRDTNGNGAENWMFYLVYKYVLSAISRRCLPPPVIDDEVALD